MNSKQQLGNPSKPERIGYSLLDTLGITYTRQHLIGKKFCVDAFLPDLDTIVQFDGDYWHGHPLKFPEPDSRQRKRMRLDRSQDAYMKVCGYSVIRVWESDLLNHPDAVTTRLRQLLALDTHTPAAQE